MRKKLSLLLSSLFLFSLILFAGCSGTAGKNPNEKFESYTRELFCQEVSSNTINLHFTLNDPKAYGIRQPPITFGTCTTDVSAVSASAENALAALRSHDRGNLNSENRLTYDILKHHLDISLKEAKYLLYEEPLAPLTGTQSQLPVLLSEFRLSDRSDIDTYLKLLSKTPEYVESICSFERTKSKSGLFMPSYNADALIKECSAFINMSSNNFLFSSFEDRLSSLDLPQKDYDSYVAENKNCIEKYVFPAYESLIKTLTALRSSGSNNNGLCYYPDGRKYYELTVKAQTGSGRSIKELQELTHQQMLSDLTAMQKSLSSSPLMAETASGASPLLKDTNPASILEELEAKLNNNFPEPPKVTTEIKYVQKSMQEFLSPAFYMVPAIDSTKNNVIYINKGHLPDDLSLYTTLAHEGYPGHLYQTIYYQSQNPDPIRNLLNFGGYTEGWATYSEMISYYYTSLPKEQATLMQKNTSAILGIYALADMGIHYDGWKLTDAVSFFRQYGITDTRTIENIYNMIIANPANYLKYYIGYVEFLELKKEALSAWGSSFTQKDFHKKILETGPAPFDILKKNILR